MTYLIKKYDTASARFVDGSKAYPTLSVDLAFALPLNENSGDTYDLLGHAHFVEQGTVGSRDGPAAGWRARDFSGNTTDYFTAGSVDSFDYSGGSWTVSAWVEIDNITDNMAGFAKYQPSKNSFICKTMRNGTPDTAALAVDGDTGGTVQVEATDFGALTTGTWYFMVWFHNDGTEIGVGVNDTFTTLSHTLGCKVDTGGWTIGSLDSYTTFEHHGGITQLCGWNRLLSATERTALYNAGAGLTLYR